MFPWADGRRRRRGERPADISTRARRGEHRALAACAELIPAGWQGEEEHITAARSASVGSRVPGHLAAKISRRSNKLCRILSILPGATSNAFWTLRDCILAFDAFRTCANLAKAAPRTQPDAPPARLLDGIRVVDSIRPLHARAPAAHVVLRPVTAPVAAAPATANPRGAATALRVAKRGAASAVRSEWGAEPRRRNGRGRQ